MLKEPKDIYEPTSDDIKINDMYARYSKSTHRVVFGEWNMDDVAVLGLEELVALRKYLDNKILRIKLDKFIKDPF